MKLAAAIIVLSSCASTGQRFQLDCSIPVGADCFALAERDCPAGYDVVSSAAITRTSQTSAGYITTNRRQIVVECKESR